MNIPKTATCAGCGADFPQKRPWQKWCTRKCGSKVRIKKYLETHGFKKETLVTTE